MAEKKLEQLDFQYFLCPDCDTSGYVTTGKCPQCGGLGLGVLYQGRFLYWDKKINALHIIQNKIKNVVEILINIILLLIGLAGLAGLAWQIYSTGFGNVLTSDFWQTKSIWLLVFWSSILVDSYIFYRLDRMSKARATVIKKAYEFEEVSGVTPNSWEDILKLKKKFKVDISKAFSRDAVKAIEKAWLLARDLNHQELSPIHLLAVLPGFDRVAVVFSRLDINLKKFKEKTQRAFNRLVPSKTAPVLSKDFKELFFNAYYEASVKKQDQVDVIELLESVAKTKPKEAETSLAQEVLFELAIETRKLENVVEWIRIKKLMRKNWLKYKKRARLRPASETGRAMTAIATPILDRFSTDVTLRAKFGYLAPCIGREKEIEEIFRIMEGNSKSVILVGSPGVGKTTIIEGIAQKMVAEEVPKILQDKRLVSLSVAQLVGGATPTQAEERLLNVMNEIARAGNIVLAIDNVHDMIGITAGREESLDLSEVLAQTLNKGVFFSIATTNTNDYTSYVENKALGDTLQRVEVDEVDIDSAIRILEAKSGSIEFKNNIYFSYDAIEKAAVLSDKFISGKYLPEKAIEIIKEVAIKVSKERGKKTIVTGEDVAQLISERTKIPLAQLTEEETAKLLNLEEQIHQRMVNQDEAVKMVSSALRRARAELRAMDRPIVNLLFLGPTGVGKTELAKSVAEVYFGSEENMIRLDMSEYQDKTSLHRLIGNPAEKSGGYLTEAVRKSPFSLVLLDEIEKAHPDILNIFLQVMDDGRLTDNAGRTINFTNVILIATSNAGAYFIQEKVREKIPVEKIKEQLIEKELKPHFRPEFLNRFDGIIVFKPLGMNEVKQIARLMLKKVEKRLKDKGINLKVTDEAIVELAKAGFDPEFGARPLRRVIQEKVDNTLANYILEGKLKRRDTVVLEKGGGVRIEKAVGL